MQGILQTVFWRYTFLIILYLLPNCISCKCGQVEFDEEGKACGVTSEGETARCKKVVCDPSYLSNKVKDIPTYFIPFSFVLCEVWTLT